MLHNYFMGSLSKPIEKKVHIFVYRFTLLFFIIADLISLDYLTKGGC